MSKQNIIVIGAGGARTAISKELSQKFKLPAVHSNYNLIVITAREVHVHLPATIRMLAVSEDNLEKSALIPYDHLLANEFGTIKFGKVVAVQKNTDGAGGSVHLEDGEHIPFRYLVLTPGSTWEGPLAALSGSKQDLLSAVKDWREKVRKSKALAIVGAGAVGLEFAGEIRDVYPDKEITIVNASSLPLNDAYPEKFRQNVLRRWQKRGMKFVLDDRIDSVPEGEFGSMTTAKGQKINADLVLVARGPKPNTEFLKSLGNNVLDARGFVRVEPTLQVSGHPDIFAAGDIIAVNEQKQLAKIPAHVAVAVANLLSLVSGKEPKKKYQSGMEAIFVTDGKYHGAGYAGVLWGLTFGDKLVPMLKGKGLFVAQTRAAMGLPA